MIARFLPMTFAAFAISALVGCQPMSPQENLEAFIESEAKSLPKKVDEYTTLVSLESKPLEIIYTYEISGLADEQVSSRKLEFEKMVRNALLANKAELKTQIRDKIKMTYVYKGMAKTELFRFTVNTWEL